MTIRNVFPLATKKLLMDTYPINQNVTAIGTLFPGSKELARIISTQQSLKITSLAKLNFVGSIRRCPHWWKKSRKTGVANHLGKHVAEQYPRGSL